MNVAEVIARGAKALAAAGVESPQLESEWLLAHVLAVPRMTLVVAGARREVVAGELGAFESLVAARATRRPLQHLVGSVSFCGLELAVNSHVLIPRAETELLAERAWEFVRTLATPERAPVVLDFGTGSGCLAIAVAVKCPQAVIHAVDVSAEALVVARENAARNGVAERVRFYFGDGFAPLPTGLRCDLLVGNPPYIPTGEIADLQPEVREHDPRLALDGGADGLDFYRRLAAAAHEFLQPHGRMMLEFGDGQGAALRGIFGVAPWRVEAVLPDLSGRERILIAALARA